MSENQPHGDALINSIVGKGTKFRGEFDLSGVLRIDGDFVGTIRTKGRVFIGSNGRAECTMYAGIVTVGGIVKGDIISSEIVTILQTGMVIGTITTPRLVIEDGVIFNGTCKVDKSCADNIVTSEGTISNDDFIGIAKAASCDQILSNENLNLQQSSIGNSEQPVVTLRGF